MTDVFSKKKRSEIMSLIRSSNTKPELFFRKMLSRVVYPLGYRYRVHHKGVPGRPDVVFVARKVAIFIDGDFWHGFDLKSRRKKLSKKYWLPKIEANIRRDKRVNAQLRKMGWKVVRIWEHDIKKKPEKALLKVKALLEMA